MASYPQCITDISIHALLAESDKQRLICMIMSTRFLSTLSLRRATSPFCGRNYVKNDFYPRSPCGERPGRSGGAVQFFCISIHALLAESDIELNGIIVVGDFISIHALLAESDSWRVQTAKPARPISIHALLAESDLYHLQK